MNVVILAAGKGSRMKTSLPKVLHTVGGTPMAGHVIRAAQSVGADQTILVIGHGADQVLASLSRFERPDCPIHFVLQDPPLGTGHAVAQTLALLSDATPTLILYGDVPLIQGKTLEALIQAAKTNHGAALLTAVLPDPTGYGRIIRDGQGRVIRCVEQRDATPEILNIKEINSGILVAPTNRLRDWVKGLSNQNSQGEYYLTDIIEVASKEGLNFKAVVCDDPTDIEGVNSLEQKAAVERVWQYRQAQMLMQQGVELADPHRFDLRGELHCAEDVTIDINCVFEGSVHLGRGVRIGPNCVLRNVSVQPNAVVQAMSILEDCQLGEYAVVGPFSRIRPGTVLDEHSHVGNFTEVKNSRLGAHSKANHLSYIGDATVGRHVNIGAGTITCNYDGAVKHQTIIEDHAFIGSDSQLVAPVVIREGATVGAGTTLTREAPANALTLSRTPQSSHIGYKRPSKKKG